MTLEVRRELRLERAPAEVFEFLADTANFSVVDPALVSYTPEGKLSLGLSGTFAHRRSGLTARSTWRVDELEPPTRLRVTVRGMGYELDETADLRGDGEGTHVTFVVRVWPTSLAGRLMVALSGGIMRRDLEARTARLQSILG